MTAVLTAKGFIFNHIIAFFPLAHVNLHNHFPFQSYFLVETPCILTTDGV